jgi:hypothetical protein
MTGRCQVNDCCLPFGTNVERVCLFSAICLLRVRVVVQQRLLPRHRHNLLFIISATSHACRRKCRWRKCRRFYFMAPCSAGTAPQALAIVQCSAFLRIWFAKLMNTPRTNFFLVVILFKKGLKSFTTCNPLIFLYGTATATAVAGVSHVKFGPKSQFRNSGMRMCCVGVHNTQHSVTHTRSPTHP